MRVALALCLSITGAACGGKKSADQAPPVRTGVAADRLWALAPPGVLAGAIVTPQGVAEVDKAFERVRKIIAMAPELAPVRHDFDRGLTAILGSTTGHLADVGMSTDLGFAMFMVASDSLVVLPVSDRAKFVAARHGETKGELDTVDGITCKQVGASYACAKTEALIAQLGKSSMVGKIANAGARGDAEVYIGPTLLGSGIAEVQVAITLDDGVLDAHAFLGGKVPFLASLVGVQALPPEPSGGGFVLGNFAPALGEVPGSSPIAALARTVKGPLAATMSSTELAFTTRVPLTDPKPLQGLLDHCDQLAGLLPLPTTAIDGACKITVPHTLVPASFEVWLEDGELRAANHKGAFPSGGGTPRTAVGRELASGAWQFALWGRGSVFATHLSMAFGQTLDPQKLPQLPIALRAFAQFSELGLGAKVGQDGIYLRAYGRTIWTNPTEVAEALAAIPSIDLISGKGDKIAADLAASHADGPFAADLAAGPGGMMMPVTIVGILAAVAIPAFMDYMKKSKVTEATLMLNRIGKNAKVYYLTDAKFPAGMATLTPASACCAGPNAHCVTTAADWAQPVWQALDFQIDRPTLFQYSYASDGTTFNATAVGDLDCDGTMITYTLSGTSDGGTPKVTLTEPPPNSD